MSLSTSSLLDLKAELLRKSEEVKKEKLQKASKAKEQRNKYKKPSVFSKKNAGVLERAQKDLEDTREEDDVLSQSRKKLEAKSRLYEKMAGTSKVSEHDGSSGFLVDFEQKSIRNISEKREEERLKREEQEKKEDEEALKDSVPESEDPSEQWVDYVDSFGRSRRCLKKDLPELQKMDKKLQNKTEEKEETEKPELMSAAMYREMVRQKWEDEERKNMTDPDGPLHYANVQFNEIRTHGVGYYQFEKDHETREEQLSALKQLREQTKELREKKEQFKQKRKAILKARLAKVKQRKLVREGKEAGGLDEEESSSSEEEHMIGPQLGEAYKGEGRQSPELLTRDESLRQDAPLRDWDIGKKNDTFDEEKWLSERRDERVNEFAPPQFYYGKSTKTTKNQRTVSKTDFAQQNTYFDNSAKSKSQLKSGAKATNPMAFLEQMAEESVETVSQNKNIENNVMAGIHEIRTAVESNGAETTFHYGVHKSGATHADIANNQRESNITRENKLNIPMDVLLLPPPPPPGMPPPPPPQVPPPVLNQHQAVHGEYHMGTLYTESSTTYGDMHMNSNPVQNEPSLAPSHSTNSESSQIDSMNKPPTKQANAAGKVHFSSAPVKYDRFTAPVNKPRYERVNLYEVPESLPAPPTVGNIPVYPSQEEVFGSKEKSTGKSDEELQRMWYRQFQDNRSGYSVANFEEKPNKQEERKTVIDRVKPANIPFVSPFVQKRDVEEESEEKIEFDPSKPPPELTSKENK